MARGSTPVVLAALVVGLAGCPASSTPSPHDAGARFDAPARDGGTDAGDPPVACTVEGAWSCTADHGTACCGGVWVYFIDQICNVQLDPACGAEVSMPDAAVYDASTALDASDADVGACGGLRQVPGCPCTGADRGCTHCGHVVTCESGVWVVDRALRCGGCT